MAHANVGERLLAYFTQRNIKMAQVSRETGIQYDSLQQILSGKVKAMGVDKFTAIWKAYPDLDAWHILTGDSRGTPHTTDLTTVEQLRAFKEEMIQVLDKRIAELQQ